MPTKVIYTKLFEKQLTRCPKSVQQKALLWIQTVEHFGIWEVRERPGYRDKPLKGVRREQRSIRLSRSYRLIYCELQKGVQIKIMEVHKHDY